MNLENIGYPVIVTPFREHGLLKERLLSAIQDTPALPYNDNDIISRTDWYCNPRRDGAGYKNVLSPYIENHFGDLLGKMSYTGFTYTGIWFQQYEKNNRHEPHRHDFVSWTNVYYLELPEDGPRTELYDLYDQTKTFIPDVKEGDILTFPGFAMHRSPPNLSDKRKTVIVFNVN